MDKTRILSLPTGAMHEMCYIVKDEPTGLGAVVDPGGDSADDGKRLILTRCEREGVKVAAILLTHAHFDHIMSLEALRDATGAPVYIHGYDAEALVNPELSYMSQFAGIDTPCRPAEHIIDEGDKIEIGETIIEVLHTPGHTPGSVIYKIDRVLLTGDTLFAGSIGRCDLYGGDELAMSDTLGRIKRLAEQWNVRERDVKLYPGHGSSTTLARELDNNIYLR